MNAPHRKNVIYVTPDIERALGMLPQPHYRIVASKNSYAESVKASYPDFITLLEKSDAPIDTPLLLKDANLRSLAINLDAGIIVFKNNSLIESIASNQGLHLLNPHASLAEKVENKVSQVEWLGGLAKKYLPPHKIKTGKELIWKKTPYIFQWAHGHTGEATHLIRSEQDAENIRRSFPDRIGRVSSFVQGPSFTVNAVVAPDRTLMGNISYQITGIAPFTDYEFSTVGNDWSLTHSLLSEKEIHFVEAMVGEIGGRLREDGWKGMFGIDFIRDDEFNHLLLIEINARQPAGAVFESHLQRELRRQGLAGLTIFEAHVHALTGEPITQSVIPLNDGAQIIQRVTKTLPKIKSGTVATLEQAGYKTISYDNTEHNANILRIQSAQGIMETHNRFNLRGKEILKTILL